MSHPDNTSFTPAQVDEQIERYLSDPPDTPADQPSLHALHTLQRLYPVKNTEHAPSLERAWQRVLTAAQESAASATIIPAATVDEPGDAPQSGSVSPASPYNARRQRMPRARRLLVQLAAVLCLVLIVGSFVLVTTLSRQGQPIISLTAGSGSGLYAYLGNTIYRLDSQTHTILWKHAFASNEAVEAGGFYGNVDLPVVVNGIMYVETHTGTTDQQYLSALNTTNGSLLWRLSSARAFVNDVAVYTLVESKTANITTLTARDLRTGRQLWQRRYPIAGAAIDPARGTDGTEGFRIITLTDQLLYAVIWYRYNGQDIFARYALSPKDGSVIWQNRDLISGRMPGVEARIVGGVIYTTEYNLKPVIPPYVDPHGMTIGEMTQSRAAAYDASTGHLLWQTPEMVGEQPNGGFYLQVSGGMLYFQTYNDDWPAAASKPNSVTTLRALSTSDGSQRWRYQWQGGSITGSVLQGQSLYFETSQVPSTGKPQSIQVEIVALNAQTGATHWTTLVNLLDGTEKTPTPPPHSVDPGFFSSFIVDMAPVASQDAIYYSTPGNKIYVLQPSTGHILSRFSVDKTPQTTTLDRVGLFVV